MQSQNPQNTQNKGIKMQNNFKTAPASQDLQYILDAIQNILDMVETAAKEKSSAIIDSLSISPTDANPLFYAENGKGTYVEDFGILTTEDCNAVLSLNNQMVKALLEQNYSLVLDTCQAVKGIYLSRSYKG